MFLNFLDSTELVVREEEELYSVLFLSHTRFTVVAGEISDVFSYVLTSLRYSSRQVLISLAKSC